MLKALEGSVRIPIACKLRKAKTEIVYLRKRKLDWTLIGKSVLPEWRNQRKNWKDKTKEVRRWWSYVKRNYQELNVETRDTESCWKVR